MVAHEPKKNERQSIQFGMQALLWTTVVIAMALAYLKQIGSAQVFVEGSVVAMASIAVGAAIGATFRRTTDAVFWSLMISTFAFVSVAAEQGNATVFRYAWSSIGIATGAICGGLAARRFIVRVTVSSVLAGATMLVFSLWMPTSTELYFDILCAPIIGGLVALLIELLFWMERNNGPPRYITACWLLLSVICGNLLAA